MEATREHKIRVLYERALTIPAEGREAFLRQTCVNEPDLVQAVLELFNPAPAQQTRGAGWIGPYRVERLLGRGGMGEVWQAVRDDGTFRKLVAIKLMTTPLEGEGQFLQRFRQEMQVLANLDHPGISRILDGGELSDGRPYMVMDFIDGLPLDKHCDERRLSIEDRVRLIIQVCEAVDYLHKAGVIHRDLKPANVMVTTSGQVKLLDFGIARVNTITADPMMTAPQHRLLTPGYASPEQMAGETCTPRSDIYSLGAVLYRLLTQQTPSLSAPTAPSGFLTTGQGAAATTAKPLPQHQLGDLDGIAMKALEHNPAKRYATALELAEDLKRFLRGAPVTARSASAAERFTRFVHRRPAFVMTGALAAVLAAAGGVFFLRQPKSVPPPPASPPVEASTPISAPQQLQSPPPKQDSPVAPSDPLPAAEKGPQQRRPAVVVPPPAPAAATVSGKVEAPAVQPPAVIAQPPAPKPAPAAPVAPAGWQDRLTNVTIKVATANRAFEQKRQELSASGLSPSSELVSSSQQMQTCLDAAQTFAKSGDWESAQDYLGRADAFATRLMRALGR